MNKGFKTLAEAIEYFNEIGPILYDLERQIKEIKQSKEYKKYQNILSVYANRDIIESAPSYKNKYVIPNEVWINEKTQKIEDFLSKTLDNTE